jgi:hypothetical protein
VPQNRIRDLAALGSFPQLQILDVYSNQIDDLNGVTLPPHLSHLDLQNNPLDCQTQQAALARFAVQIPYPHLAHSCGAPKPRDD